MKPTIGIGPQAVNESRLRRVTGRLARFAADGASLKFGQKVTNLVRFSFECVPIWSYISYRAELVRIEVALLALTRKADYALVALSELARHAPATLSARTLAEQTGIPLPVLSGVLNQLVHHELVTSVRGVQGGYRLARSANAICLVDVIEAIDGSPRLTQCCSSPHSHDAKDANEPCTLEPRCRITGPMQKVHQGLLEFMSKIVLAQIAFDTVPVRVEVRKTGTS